MKTVWVGSSHLYHTVVAFLHDSGLNFRLNYGTSNKEHAFDMMTSKSA